MKDLSVSQNYLICALNESGKLSALNMGPVCLLAGGLIDLIAAKSIAIDDDKKLRVTGGLGEEYQYLNSIYTFIKDSKPMKIDQLALEYAFTFSDKHIKALFNDVGTSLAVLEYVSAENGGLFGNTPRFIPDMKIVDHVIQNIRAELLENGALSDTIIALASLLDRSNQMKRYFSKYEKDQLKERLKEIRNSSANKLVKEMIDSIDTMIAVIAATAH